MRVKKSSPRKPAQRPKLAQGLEVFPLTLRDFPQTVLLAKNQVTPQGYRRGSRKISALPAYEIVKNAPGRVVAVYQLVRLLREEVSASGLNW